MTDMTTIEDLVGEGKKYATADDLAASRLHADEHIQNIEEENKQLRDQLSRSQTAEDLFKSLKQEFTQTPLSPLSPPEEKEEEVVPPEAERHPQPSEPSLPSADGGDLSEIVAKEVERLQNDAQRKQNETASAEIALRAFGDRSREKIIERSRELGVSVDEIVEIGRRSPKLFATTLGVAAVDRQTSTNPAAPTPTSTVAAGSGGAALSSEDPFRSVESMKAYRKKIGDRAFFSAEVQNKYFEAAKKNPEIFFGN